MPIPVNSAMVDTIAGDKHWGSATITYAIDLEGPGAKNQDQAQSDFGAPAAFQSMSLADQLAIEEVAKLWDDLIPVSLAEVVNSNTDITVDQVTNIPAFEGGVTFTTGHSSSLDSAGVYLEPRPLTIGSDYDWSPPCFPPSVTFAQADRSGHDLAATAR
jgi:hypothetical protein